MFITRNDIKTIANLALSAAVAQQVSNAVVDNTELDEDAIRVRVGSAVVGTVAANTARPATDRIVDAIADKYVAFRNRNKTPEVV